MWDVAVGKAADYGILGILFIILLWWALKKNDERELRYIEREDKYLAIINTMNGEMTERLTRIEYKMDKARGGD